MSFMDSYKRLDKLCGEIMEDDRRLTAYIDEMKSISDGADIVPGWYTDMKKLRYYRRIRNQIAHDPECTEENMCTASDIKWVDGFYKRVIDGTDPLALYYKKRRQIKGRKSNKVGSDKHGDGENSRVGCGYVLVFAIFCVAILAVWGILWWVW